MVNQVTCASCCESASFALAGTGRNRQQIVDYFPVIVNLSAPEPAFHQQSIENPSTIAANLPIPAPNRQIIVRRFLEIVRSARLRLVARHQIHYQSATAGPESATNPSIPSLDRPIINRSADFPFSI
jgi:hypothetical protein